MRDYCFDCEYQNDCSDIDVGFCYDCKEKRDCDIKTSCKAGYDIRCNNGYEEEAYVDDEENDDECEF
jgi:hypothetical protein